MKTRLFYAVLALFAISNISGRALEVGNALGFESTVLDTPNNSRKSPKDKTLPMPQVQISGLPLSITTAGQTTIDIEFSEPVNGFDISDIVVNNASLANFMGAQGSATYSVVVSYGQNVVCDGLTVDVTVPSGVAIGVNTSQLNTAASTTGVGADTTSPSIVLQDIDAFLDNNGQVIINASDFDNGSTDNCTATNDLVFTVNTAFYNCSNLGSNSVVVTVTDAIGNSASVPATVNVIDNIAPVPFVPGITVQLDANGQVSITPNDFNTSANFENCAIAFQNISQTNFDCSDIGQNNILFVLTDTSNNVGSNNTTVTVEDNIAPNIITQNVTVTLNAMGNASITANDIDGGSSDNCAIASITASQTAFTCADVGANNVTLSVTDVNGNTSTGTATVTVNDQPMTAIAQNITILLDANGQATITPQDVDNGSGTSCNNNPTLSLSDTTFDCSDVGPNTVTLTATDGTNTDTATAIVTVQDGAAPVLQVSNATLQLGNNGTATLAPADVIVVATDNCGIQSTTLSQTAFDCTDVGTQQVLVTLTDVNGLQSSLNATVTIEDNVAPNVITQNFTVTLNTNGQASITANDIDGGSSDNCAIASRIASQTVFTCADLGTNNVTLSVTDVNGNTTTDFANVTVNELPLTALTQNITVQLDANGQATITPQDVDNGSGSSCNSNPTLSLDVTNFDCSSIGANIVTLTATDGTNTDTETAVVTVEDVTPPFLSLANPTIMLDANGTATITAADIVAILNDNCTAQPTITLSWTTFDCSDIGNFVPVLVTATDAAGNANAQGAALQVEDNVAPNVITQNFTVTLNTNGQASITAADIDGGSSDNCAISSITASPSNFSCANIGTNTVTLSVTDVNGNTSTGTATVTVNESPVTAVAQNITVQLDANGQATITPQDVDNGSGSGCNSNPTLSLSDTTFDCSNIGSNTVTLTATDGTNTDTATATVTIEDDVPPTATVQNLTIQLDNNGQASITAADVDGGSTDNCAVASVSINTGNFDCSNVGPNTVTLTVTDVNGNTSTDTATITVEDNVAPNVITQNFTVTLNTNGQASITANDIDGGSSDNCALASITASPTTFTCANVGANTVTLSVTDVNGNTSTGTATVTVNEQPMTAIAQNITVQLDANGQASITPQDVDNDSSSSCNSNPTLSLDITNFDCSEVGPNTVTLTATDGTNTDTATATVTIEDNVPPTATAQNLTIQLGNNGQASITATDVDGGSTDNCAVALVSINTGNFDCSNVGANTVTLTVTDVNGNTSTDTATVTVKDKEEPKIITQKKKDNQEKGQASITANDIDGGSSDNCAIASITANQTTFTCADLGANNVVLSVTDVSGNTTTDFATVTVNEQPMTAIVQNITVQLDANGQATITPQHVDNGSGSGCNSNPTLSLDITNFDCSDIGSNTVTLTATDGTNTDTATATVTVEDTLPPSLTLQNFTLVLGANNTATLTAPDVVVATSDNCSAPSLTLGQSVFDCSNVGNNEVQVTARDAEGNSVTFATNVIVEDNTPPTVITQNVTLTLNTNGQATITANDIDGGSSDNCAIASRIAGQTTFTCADLGTNNVTLSVTDVSGNTTTDFATVTINESPLTAVAQDITVQLDANGQVTIPPQDVDNGSSSGCNSSPTLSLDVTAFDCSNIGTNTVTLTATDGTNTDTATATVTVEDTLPPSLTLQNFTLVLGANNTATLTAPDVVVATSDNCSAPTLTLSQSVFDCSNIGNNEVQVTADDGNGNSVTFATNVTIQDNTLPVAIAQDLTVQLDTNGQATVTTADIDNGSSDNCAIASIVLDRTDFSCADLGQNTVTLTVTDVNGNVGTATATVTVEEDPNQPLTAIAQDVTVQLDANGSVSIVSADIDNGSNSGCNSSPTLSLDTDTFSCADLGANTVTLTATEGNVTSIATATVTVVDDIAPNLVLQNTTIVLAANNIATLTISDVVVSATDNCTVQPTVTLAQTNFDCSNVGNNEVQVTAMDAAGNSITFATNVIVEDNTDPVVVAQDITVQLDLNGEASILAADLNNGSSDNCAIASITASPITFSCADVGTNTVTLTVTDVSGNVNTATATVTVQENFNRPLTAVTQDITVQLDASGQVTITPQDVDNGSGSGCNGNPTLSLDVTTFDCSNLGINTVTLTVTDGTATDTATATITVEDNLGPEVSTQDITLTLDANGTATLLVSDIDNNSRDNCTATSDLIFNLDKTNFECNDIGSNTVTLTIQDNQGNSSSNTAIVTVTENVPPTVRTRNITKQVGEDGITSISPEEIDDGSFDNCGGDLTLEVDALDLICPALGELQVTLTATDTSGNSASATAIVTLTGTDTNGNQIPDGCETVELDIPSGFSPNADNVNDTWVIENITSFPNNKVTVFNRWGEKVFEQSNYQNNWNAISNQTTTSKRLPAGSYLYIVELGDANTEAIQGWLYINY